MTSIEASPPWLLAYGGNDDGLQTGPLKEVQLEGRYAPSSGFILHDGLSCQVNVDRYSNRHFSHTSTTLQCSPVFNSGNFATSVFVLKIMVLKWDDQFQTGQGLA